MKAIERLEQLLDVRTNLLTCTECGGDGEIGCIEPCECPDEVCWACRGSGVAK